MRPNIRHSHVARPILKAVIRLSDEGTATNGDGAYALSSWCFRA